MKNIKTIEEAKAHILGKIAGLNVARIMVWGIGYDNDKTALMIRKNITTQIYDLKEILEIEHFGDSMFSSACDLIKDLEKGE